MCPLWVHRLAVTTAGATLVLIFVGALVTSTGSGLAVPDWPLSFGQVFPPMVGGVLYEHGHRLVAAFVGMLTVTLMVIITHWEPRHWVRWIARGAVVVVLLQGILGGITVLLRLPTVVSVMHACLAQAFFMLTIVLAICTGPSWGKTVIPLVEPKRPTLASLAALTVGAIYLQLIAGALMRHTGAGLAIPDFPLAFGRVFPPLESAAVIIHFIHRLGALVVTGCAGWTVVRVMRQYRQERLLVRPAMLLAALLLMQLTLGAYTIWSQRAILLMTAHVAVGAAVLATSLALMLRAMRLVTPPARMVGDGVLSARVTA
ncbi:MAG: heme A synthase [Candidatus Tectomicrobia bacterium]|uniref:Heme A synthase n=1 Tax=Tectimicrobiota bacterium TaxID=2528274 RepID=A0A937W6L5_UNCTE|nr:heme A synthase [Candidatus Tectomicrobia bacterium]